MAWAWAGQEGTGQDHCACEVRLLDQASLDLHLLREALSPPPGLWAPAALLLSRDEVGIWPHSQGSVRTWFEAWCSLF